MKKPSAPAPRSHSQQAPKEKKIMIEIEHFGPVAQHNLLCWFCNKRPAVYSMHPEWVFKPCWKCQANIHPKKISWWQLAWKNLKEFRGYD